MAWNWLFLMNKTIETATDYPYSYSVWQANFTANQTIPPKISSTNYFLPFKTFSFSGSSYYDMSTTPSIKIYNNDTVSFPAATITTIKSYLCRGIAIAVALLTNSTPAFMNYAGGG